MTALEEAWKRVERWAGVDRSSSNLCLLDLRRRVEALEQRAAPAPAPAADRPLWEVMYDDCCAAASEGRADLAWRTAAEIDAVADWLEDKGYLRGPELLRAEARRAREGQ